jgi:hypothetical protein
VAANPVGGGSRAELGILIVSPPAAFLQSSILRKQTRLSCVQSKDKKTEPQFLPYNI